MMGVDCALFERLLELGARADFAPGRGLMLGRQGFHFQGRYRRRYRLALARAGVAAEAEALAGPDGFAEPFFRAAGLGEMEAMDASAYEGAAHVHDLNEPVPAHLHEAFDFIFDGGTIEHVFDAPQALSNVFAMLKPGGVFASANGMNGWPFHGLYQFNPEFAWSYWKRAAGCEVLRVLAVPANPAEPPIPLPDAAETGRRLRLSRPFPEGRVYLYYEVRKGAGARPARAAWQSDYQARWREAAPEMTEA